MNEQISLLFLISRYMHVVAASLLLGGTLFYELIVPVAIDDLKDEQKLAVFGRARWAFRWIVWCSTVVLLLSGSISTYRNWYAYNGSELAMTKAAQGVPTTMVARNEMHLAGPGYWWLAHAIGAIAALSVALGLVIGGTPPRFPLIWMRINMLVILLAIFLASTTRHLRLRMLERNLAQQSPANIE